MENQNTDHPVAHQANAEESTATPAGDNGQFKSALVSELREHPLIKKLYGSFDGTEDALLESVRTGGILTPLLITPKGIVISGRERLRVAQALGLLEVPVRILGKMGKLDIEQLVIASNVSRDKTNEQKIREYRELKRIEGEKAKSRKGKRTDLVPDLTPGEGGKSRDIAAAKVGWSGGTAEKGVKVFDAIDATSGNRNQQDVELVRGILNNQGVDAAHKKVIEFGWIEGAKHGGKSRGASPAILVQASFKQATTAAAKLAEIVNGDEIARFTPEQSHELRKALEPILKWVDGLDPVEHALAA